MYEVPKHIASKLTKDQIDFLKAAQHYIDSQFYYYGSIERIDYLPGKSDIDIDIFTPNLYSTMFKLRQFLLIPETGIKNIKWRTRRPIVATFHCHKIKFDNGIIKLELNIYDDKYKNTLLQVRELKRNIPFAVLMLVYTIKSMYYNTNLISNSHIAIFKKFVMGQLLDMEDDYNI
jgi:hypothetical protein